MTWRGPVGAIRPARCNMSERALFATRGHGRGYHGEAFSARRLRDGTKNGDPSPRKQMIFMTVRRYVLYSPASLQKKMRPASPLTER